MSEWFFSSSAYDQTSDFRGGWLICRGGPLVSINDFYIGPG